jgi:rare lipoprotein A
MMVTAYGYPIRRIGFLTLVLIAATVLSPDVSARDTRSGKDTHAAKGTRVGFASYYGKELHGKKTAAGKTFDRSEMVAAHPTYPLGTRVKVTNLSNGRSEEVRIVDRGPTREHQKRGVIIDLSEQAAIKLGFHKKGKTRVKIEVLEWGDKYAK